MPETKLHFYAGTRGMGVVVAVSCDNDRIIFDFGAPFTPLSAIYDGQIRHRIKNKVKDAILLKRIPAVPGVFAKKDLSDLDLESYEESSFNTAVFICHLHLDHMSEIDKLSEHIPIYIHEDGLKLFNCLNKIGDEKGLPNVYGFTYHDTIEIGEIRVTPYFSDHPCPGSSGFLIKTPDSVIYYSGDIRFHGRSSQKAFAEMESLKQEDIDLLIVDSTTSSSSEFEYLEGLDEEYRKPSKILLPGCISEQDIYDDIYDSLKDYPGLGIFNSYERDTSMMAHLYDLSKRLNRTLVMEASFAYILYKMEGISVPVCLYDNQYPSYLDEIKDLKIIDIQEIRKDPQNYLLQNSYDHILTLSDLDQIKGKYFHLFGEPLVKGERRWQIMLNIIAKAGFEFSSFSNLYSFSHAYPNHLSWLLETLGAKSVVAVHSKHPENLHPTNSTQYFPDEEKEYILKNGVLAEAEE